MFKNVKSIVVVLADKNNKAVKSDRSQCRTLHKRKDC